MEYVLGVDIGTGSVKAVAVELKCQSFEVCQRHYSFSSPKPGYHEQDPELILNAFIDSIRTIIDKIGSQPLAVGLSSAMHSLIAVDKNCRPLAPMITWADNRSSEIATALRATSRGLDIYRATGTPLHAMSPLCKIIWIRENDPALFNNTYKFISIKEYIWHKFFNEFKIDHSGASCTGLFDINKLCWHQDALDLAGITADSLSEPVSTDYTQSFNHATTDPLLNFLKPGTPFIIGASDGCLANLGSMADKPGVAAITIGTSGAVRVASSKPLPNEKAMTFSYILDKQTYVCGGPINNGGIALQWWLKNSKPEPTDNDYAELFEQITNVPPGSDGLVFLPYLTGERAPVWDSEGCGIFFGARLLHTQAHFSRAVLEGICYALNDVLDAVQQNAEPITQINVSGGFVKADVWVQTLADITGKKLVIVQSEDASAIGAGFMALKCIGSINEYPSSGFTGFKTFIPNPANAGVYANNFAAYKQLYPALKETMHRVYEKCRQV
jgi:gluconokinase